MTQISTVVSTVASLVSKLEAVDRMLEKLRELVKNKGDKNINQQFFDLQSQINDVKEDIRKLKQEIEDLGQVDKNQYDFKDGMYRRKSDGDGPFCQTCLDKDGKAILLQPNGATGNFHCEVCKGQFSTPSAGSNFLADGSPSRFEQDF